MLEVKRSGYYAWDKRLESKRSIRERNLTELVKKEFYENKQIPGSVKIAEMLSKPESPVNRKTISKIMRNNGWKSCEYLKSLFGSGLQSHIHEKYQKINF
ncbi:IS3 family transposase [Pseudobacteroides cellulosolvens]|uniref:HTH-like domain containing protein n=1 Tax=Pseudobacteroides cellulosolvens ATCC 35603 = DSM 2933 TaxID=398512 RepID=A0A0L6JXU8_9FIRM|nr:IS3 family transposase [Pseudobacteroides cellulosolvens]KNY30257.1 HTH-like domain containing protein [Pseudobacteroides cellulosolvens ATCC 35603 = DSM 2933]